MKELTIEEKAKRFDEALNEAITAYKDEDRHLKATLERIFPELKKKTDEEIRQQLIAVCHLYYGDGIDTERDECLEWLEKQKVKPYSGVSFLYNNHTWGMCARDKGVDILCDSKLIKHIEQGKTIFEKLSEQMPTDKIQLGKEYKCIASPRYTMFLTGDIYKPEDRFLCSLMNLCSDCFELVEDSEQNDFTSNIDKVEPKFKVGNWIITPENKVLQITSIQDTSYKFNNESHYWEVYYCDKWCRLWSIADAKDGDVLMGEDDYPFIYADNHIYTKYLTAYCGITNDGVFKISDKTELWTNDNVEPASKEQRNMLFSKMKEAGYEWDAEKKELIKIE